jgi:AcrR family transcriptional regulator
MENESTTERPHGKLSGEERKASIVKAVRHLFAEKGFAGITTRELAAAAGVSEALLYRHFPTKEALYEAILQSILDEHKGKKSQDLMQLEPSVPTLALLIHSMAVHMAQNALDRGERAIPHRLALRSMVEDGEFARILHQHLTDNWAKKVSECVEAAGKSGDLIDDPTPNQLAGPFTFDLIVMLMARFLPPTPVVNFGPPDDNLIHWIVRYALRGIGIKEESIRKHYRPETLVALGL